MQVQEKVSLQDYNTLRLISKAEYFCRLSKEDEVSELISHSQKLQKKIKILGGGSNLVVPSNIQALVVKNECLGKKVIKQDSDFTYVSCMAGEVWHEFVVWTLDHGMSGLENLSLIPGTVGAAPIQNIGAYGVEVKDCIEKVIAWDLEKNKKMEFTKLDCHFTYRDSFFKKPGHEKYLITEVIFKLPKKFIANLSYSDLEQQVKKININVTPKSVSQAVIRIRESKLPDPKMIGNAGSFFKNPIVAKSQLDILKKQFPNIVSYPYESFFKLAAGWLIEQAGWKGKSLGPVAMYEKQALVLVNKGLANSEDVWKLAQSVQADVFSKFGVTIEPEPIKWD